MYLFALHRDYGYDFDVSVCERLPSSFGLVDPLVPGGKSTGPALGRPSCSYGSGWCAIGLKIIKSLPLTWNFQSHISAESAGKAFDQEQDSVIHFMISSERSELNLAMPAREYRRSYDAI
jgi:hypothetical protein